MIEYLFNLFFKICKIYSSFSNYTKSIQLFYIINLEQFFSIYKQNFTVTFKLRHNVLEDDLLFFFEKKVVYNDTYLYFVLVLFFINND